MDDREALLTTTFVEAADTLVADFELVVFLNNLINRCVELFDAQAACLMLADDQAQLRVMSCSSDDARVLHLLELQQEAGPCYECYRNGGFVSSQSIEDEVDRWPGFGSATVGAGFKAVHAIPMRLRGELIGALSLFRTKSGPMSESDIRAAQALADVATIGILQERAIREIATSEQLRSALDSRIVIEQAKGKIAALSGLGMDLSFARIRRYARDHNLRLSEVARRIIDGDLTGVDLLEGTAGTPVS